jgi:predicted N-formylglutamate amidohydrolase
MTSPHCRIQTGADPRVLVVCDHAANAIPDELGDLGLSAAQRADHIAWDPGAAGVAARLAERLDATALFGRWSRLVVDLNRAPGDATLILAESDNVFVSGNLPLSDGERRRRIIEYHSPYHARIDAEVDARLASGVHPLLIAVHSFTPVYGGNPRPWQVGVLWKLAREPVAGLIDHLAAQGWTVGDNHPYDGRVAMGWTLDRHAIQRGLPHVMFEIRNDEIADAAAQARWGDILADALVASGFLARAIGPR